MRSTPHVLTNLKLLILIFTNSYALFNLALRSTPFLYLTKASSLSERHASTAVSNQAPVSTSANIASIISSSSAGYMLLSSTAAFHLPNLVLRPLSYSFLAAPGGAPISLNESLPKLQTIAFDGSNCVPRCDAIPKHLSLVRVRKEEKKRKEQKKKGKEKES